MIWRLRVLLFYALVATSTVLMFAVVFLPVKLFNTSYSLKYKIALAFSSTFIFFAKVICDLNYKVTGLDKLPKTASIVMSNHQSFWENVFMQIIIPEHSWVIKKELFDIPFFGWAFRWFEPVAVDRSNSRSIIQILNDGQTKLKSGLWIIIFPEATRLAPEQNTNFKPSAANLALAANVPVVLMAHNAGLFWPKGFWIKKPGTISVKIIEVISPKDLCKFDIRSLTDYVEEIITKEKQRLCSA